MISIFDDSHEETKLQKYGVWEDPSQIPSLTEI